jgi:endonuclease G
MANSVELQFNYQYSLDGSVILPHVTYEFDPASFFDTSVDLDFTVIRVRPRSVLPTDPGGTMSTRNAGEEFGFLQLTDKYVYTKGQLANVVQHPDGRPKEIALHDNVLDGVYANVIRYTTDTESGSSGAPVFNNSWRVIALHHAAGDRDPQTGAWKNNEGVRIDSILKHMRSKYLPEILKELGI